MEDVGDDGLVHPVAPPQQAFGQIRHRAAVAELKGHKGEGRMRGRRDRNAPVPKKGAESSIILLGGLSFWGSLTGGGRGRNPRVGTFCMRGLIYAAMTKQDKY